MRSLKRGLQLLGALERGRARSLNDLHVALELPKPTILRLLETLIETGHVRRRIGDGGYLLRIQRSDPEATMVDRLAELASPALATLARAVGWPSVLAIPAADHMVVLETNHPMVKGGAVRLGPVGVRLSYLHTATGRAYLSACDAAERERVIRRLRSSDAAPGQELAFQRILRETARRGYATREPWLDWPGFMRSEVRQDGRLSIAVPIVCARAIAAVNVSWPRAEMTVETLVDRHWPALEACARTLATLPAQAEPAGAG